MLEFTRSSEYKVLYDYPQSVLKTTIEVINDFELFQRWDEDSILKFLRLLDGTANYSDNPEADGALLTVYNIVKAYFNYLITENKLNMSRETLQDLQESFEKSNELYVVPKFSGMQTGLKAWNWQAAHQIDQNINKWVGAYVEVLKHPERIDPKRLLGYMRSLSKQIYDRYRLTPNNWKRKTIEETIKGYLSQSIMTKDYCIARNREIASLLGFLVDQKWMKGKQANIINRSLRASVEEIDQELKYFYEFEPEVVYAEKVRDFSITNEGFILRFLHDVDEYAVDNGVEEDVLPF